jgi:ABC-2 type transport system ATP-binding protein
VTELAIRTAGLTKTYACGDAVRGLALNVPRGSIYGFLGCNGAGKTTTIKLLTGLMRPTSGRADVLGMDVAKQRLSILRRTAFVNEKKALYPSLTGEELVRFSRGFYPSWSDRGVERYSRLLEIPMRKPFRTLSNGNQTKLCLLLALCQGADLLILDEPTTALDPVSVEQLLRALVEHIADRECTIFFSSHQLEEVERIVEYVGVLEAGRLVLESKLDDIKTEFRMVTAAGRGLPARTSSRILSVDIDGDFHRYIVTSEAEAFAAELSAQGAAVAEIATLGLREIFLNLAGKGSSCTSGNAGATLAPSSPSSS